MGVLEFRRLGRDKGQTREGIIDGIIAKSKRRELGTSSGTPSGHCEILDVDACTCHEDRVAQCWLLE